VSQRPSGYERKERDLYETPAWVTAALVPHVPDVARRRIWEPAAGKGQMVRELANHCPNVRGRDIEGGVDFLQQPNHLRTGAIITNPPYKLARPWGGAQL
jgi:hypothetical protein